MYWEVKELAERVKKLEENAEKLQGRLLALDGSMALLKQGNQVIFSDDLIEEACTPFIVEAPLHADIT